MYLYLVTCVYKGIYDLSYLDVYVVASDPIIAVNLAINLMKKLNYKYQDYVSNIKVIASVNTHQANDLLVVQ